MKQIKDGKRSHIRAIVFISAKMKEARIAREHLEKVDSGPNAMFCDDDINFDLQLEQFGVSTTELKQPVKRISKLGLGYDEVSPLSRLDWLAQLYGRLDKQTFQLTSTCTH